MSDKQERIDAFRDLLENDEEGLLKLQAYASKLLKVKCRGKFARHYEPYDVIMDIITKTIDGKRSWDMDRVPCVKKYLYMQIKSRVDSIARKEGRRPNFQDKLTNNQSKGEQNYDTSISIPIDDILRDRDIKEIFEKIYKKLEPDTEAALVLSEWRDQNSNKEITEKYGMTNKEIENAKNRIRYAVNNHFTSIKEDFANGTAGNKKPAETVSGSGLPNKRECA